MLVGHIDIKAANKSSDGEWRRSAIQNLMWQLLTMQCGETGLKP